MQNDTKAEGRGATHAINKSIDIGFFIMFHKNSGGFMFIPILFHLRQKSTANVPVKLVAHSNPIRVFDIL